MPAITPSNSWHLLPQGPTLFRPNRIGPGEIETAMYQSTMSGYPSPILFGLYRVGALGGDASYYSDTMSLSPRSYLCLVYTEVGALGEGMPAITLKQDVSISGPILFVYRVDALGEGMPAITLIQCLYFRSYPVWSIQS